MFAVKSMDVNYNLLKLKLDMVYRNIPMEEASKTYTEIVSAVQPPETPLQKTEPPKRERKKIKALVPKSNK